MKLLLLADLHLGAPCPEWGPRGEDRREEIRRALAEAVELSLAESIHAVLIGGDLFDRPDPDPELSAFVMEQFEKLTGAGILVVLVPGHFDASFASTSFYRSATLPESVVLVESAQLAELQFILGGETLNLYTLAWQPGRTPEDAFAGLRRNPDHEGVHIGLFHGDLMPSDLSSGFGPCLRLPTKAVTESNLDLILLGRSHHYRNVDLGATTVVSPGTPVGLSPGEWGPRHWTIAEGTAGVLTVTRRPRVSPEIRAVDWSFPGPGVASDEQLVAGLTRAAGDAAMAVVTIRGEVFEPLDLESLVSAFPADGPAIELVDETKVVRAKRDRDAGVQSVHALFIERMLGRIDEAESPEEVAVLQRALRVGVARLRGGETVRAH